MKTLMGHWEELIADFLDEQTNPIDPEVVETIKAGCGGFSAGAAAVLERLADGATLQELAQELEEFSKAVG
jgi:hypothetical protein